jgi:ribosomal protein S18 acetylase RimI-like enzyme
MNKYHVRHLKQVDREYWLAMWNQYLDFYQTNLPDQITTTTFERLISADKDIGCLIAIDDHDRPIGFLTFVIRFSTWSLNPVCYMPDLFVKLTHRKAGVAKLLMLELKKICVEQLYSETYWITKPDNVIAKKFYDQIAKRENWDVYTLL